MNETVYEFYDAEWADVRTFLRDRTELLLNRMNVLKYKIGQKLLKGSQQKRETARCYEIRTSSSTCTDEICITLYGPRPNLYVTQSGTDCFLILSCKCYLTGSEVPFWTASTAECLPQALPFGYVLGEMVEDGNWWAKTSAAAAR
eukprot:TRINITY_DN63509_c0_g1_i1.p1 TRINITY_DN63509_c0_g1~~TRINITY_DN63509_c0_g1_i1.p1  ORF type:complete len:145 (+),score=4.73 TRINITY_DN63509_c0_g1_i1:19-453(+)